MIYNTVSWAISKGLFLIEERSVKVFQTCTQTLSHLRFIHFALFFREREALFNAQFYVELINSK